MALRSSRIDRSGKERLPFQDYAPRIITNRGYRGEANSSGELNQAITPREWSTTEGNRAGCKLDIFELGAVLECVTADSVEVFVADNAFKGGAGAKRHMFDDCELIGEGDALEGEAVAECASANSLEVSVADDALEGGAIGESQPFDDFELIGESDAREGQAFLECCLS